MAQKKTILLIGAAVVVFTIILFGAVSGTQKLKMENENLQREAQSLSKKNESLANQVTQEQKEKKDLKNRLAEVEKDLDRFQGVAKERDELQKKYEALSRERDDLADRLSKAKTPEVMRAQAPAPSATPVLSDDLYWAGILKEKTNLDIQVGNLKNELKEAKIRLGEVDKVRGSLESEIKNLKELDIKNLTMEKQELERRIGYNERLIDSLSLELVREKKDNRKLKEDYKILNNENEELKKEVRGLVKDIKGLNEDKVGLEDKLQKTELAKSDIERRMIEMNSVLDEKTNEIIDMKQKLELIKQEKGLVPLQKLSGLSEKPRAESSVELPPIIVRPAEAEAPNGNLGKVLEINSSNKFVILDAGEEQGVKPGMSLGIYRGNKRIATLEVIQTRKNISAADIKQVIQPIKVGDIVR